MAGPVSPLGGRDLAFVPKVVGLKMYTTVSKVHTACKLLPGPPRLPPIFSYKCPGVMQHH